MPGSAFYKPYVSSLSGRIDPKFSQKYIVDEYGGFAVPFHYGDSKRPTRFSGMFDNSDNDCIGKIWEREVDEEARLIVLKNPPKKKDLKARSKKRKATEPS